MRKIFLLLLFYIANLHSMLAQNWQSVPANDTNWFVVNDTKLLEEGQLRVIWLDSSTTNGNFFEGFFCRAIRPLPSDVGCFDTLGSSWMGKRYVHNLANGDEYFFNLLGDTSILKTKAQVSDTWIMAIDSLGVEFRASVYEASTMMVDDVLDSVKFMSVQAYQGATPISHLCNDTLLLSKNHGFIRTPEWYSFPYEIPWSWTTYLHRSFSIGQNRLNKSKVMVSLNETKLKYTPGNEWITQYTESPFTTTYTHDSIISVVDTSIGYRVNFVRKQKIIDLITLAETNTILMMSELKDTTLYVANSIYQLLPEFMGFEFYNGFPTFLNSSVQFLPSTYTVSNACNGAIKVEKDLSGYAPNVFELSGCYVGAFPLGDPPVFVLTEEQVLGRKTLVENGGTIFPLDTFKHLYYNINGCLLGTKINFIVGVDELLFDVFISNGKVNLNWKTIHEKNVSRFEVQRKLPTIDFVTVGNVLSKGDNPLTNQYTYQDEITSEMQGKELLYRIKMIDHDGREMYSNVIHLNTMATKESVVYPNPFKDNIVLKGLDSHEEYQIELKDMTGRVVLKLNAQSGVGGCIEVLNIVGLERGSYILNIKSEQCSTKLFNLFKL